jgi:hypothetical protein
MNSATVQPEIIRGAIRVQPSSHCAKFESRFFDHSAAGGMALFWRRRWHAARAFERLLALSAAALVLGACSPPHQPVQAKEADASMTASRQPADGVDPDNTMVSEVAPGPKAELVALAADQLRQLDAKIEELVRRAGTLRADAGIQVEWALAELRRQRDSVARQIESLRPGNAEIPQESRARLTCALSELKRLYESAWLKLDECEAAKPAGVPTNVNPQNRD